MSRTYAGYDSHAPIAAHLGQEDWYLALELREGKRHSAEETQYTLERILPRAMALTAAPILGRIDSGFDSQRLMGQIVRQGTTCRADGGAAIDVLVKWNSRSGSKAKIIATAQANNDLVWSHPREGKRATVFSEAMQRAIDGQLRVHTRAYRVVERTIDRRGQRLLIPEWNVDGWETTLTVCHEEVIALYADHGAHEQFLSEFKTDLDLERLPSGKFDTNETVPSLAVLAYNCLRLIGQHVLLGRNGPVRHPAKRRRLKKVMYLAATVGRIDLPQAASTRQCIRRFQAADRFPAHPVGLTAGSTRRCRSGCPVRRRTRG